MQSKDTPKKLFLLDAMALIYRSHFAFSKNPMVNSKGVNTGATFGFTNSLLEVINKEKPSHIGVAFDTSAPTFRHETFKEYKAQREEQPEDIQVAIPKVKEIVKAFNLPVLEMDGYEGDDIIGTLAKKGAEKGYEVYMMTPDKDFGQLVNDHIYLYKPAFMGNSVDIWGEKEVLEKFKIQKVDQVRDILGLQGDSVDNIPGIPGVGPKTASNLLHDFGSIENLLKHTGDLKGKQKEKVEQFGKQGLLSKQLATIYTEVPIEFNEEALAYHQPDEERLKAIFKELEFRSIARRMFGDDALRQVASQDAKTQQKDQSEDYHAYEDIEALAPEDRPVLPDHEDILTTIHDYHLINSPGLRKSLIDYLSRQDAFCFDTETNSINAYEASLVGFSFAYYPGEAYYVPVPEDEKEAKAIVDEFKPLFEKSGVIKIGQNLKYDIIVLRRYGIYVEGPYFDTMIAHYLIDPDNRHGMDTMAENLLHYRPVPIKQLIGGKPKGKNADPQGSMRDVPMEKIVEYASEDADITLQLKNKLEEMLRKQNLEQLYYEVEGPLIEVLVSMEYEGVKVDVDALKELSVELGESLKGLEKEIYQLAGEEFNIGSPKQLGEILFDKLKVEEKPKKTPSGQYATGEDILTKLAGQFEIAQKILDWRELQKLKNTYVDTLPGLISSYDGRIHTSYNQAVAATGRLSSTNPNLQNIPIRTEKGRLIRKAFVPRNDDFVLMAADYSQVELRIMASFAKDESMIEAFRQGRDIHATTASKIFNVGLDEVNAEMRRKAKTANFGIIYGVSAFGLAQQLGISRKEAAEIIEAYFKEFPAIKAYMDRVIEQAREKEYVTTLKGRKRFLRDINSRNATLRGYAERNAINAPIQGTAADMIKIAMDRIYKWIKKEGLKSRMIMQVHDELIFDVHKDEQEVMEKNVTHFMKEALPLEVPMEIETGFGENWLVAH